VLLEARVLGDAMCRVSREEITAFRRNPPATPAGWTPIAPTALRYSDEQTIAGVVALVSAMGALQCADPSAYDRWGVLAATRFLGRSTMVVTLNRFRSEGVWGVSPHLIPHHSLHSPAGTFSLILGIHGPNLGIGGGLFAGFEGILTALSWLNSRVVPGVWLVLTRWYPDFAPDHDGNPQAPVSCQALALALVPADPADHARPALQLLRSATASSPQPLDILKLAKLLDPDPVGMPAREPPGISRWRGHEAHLDGSLPRPHFGRKRRQDVPGQIIATDARGSIQLAVVSPRAGQPKEHA
jgi:hypothetical protein